MASRKKQPEGIALLSMYNDDEEEEEEEDEEMEDLNAQPQLDEDEPAREPNQMESDSDKEIPEDSNLTANNPFVAGLHKSPGDVIRVLSPGNEVAYMPSEQLEPLEAARMSDIVMEAKALQVDDTGFVPEEDFDLLNRFLPPPPKEKCQEELQKKIERFLALKKVGRSFNAEVRNRKDYRNPDFLLHAVRYQDIDQVGSCFIKDVFDPHGYDKSDYYDEIEMDMKRERERREQELKRSPKVEFVGGGTQPGTVLAPPKFSMPVSGSSMLSLPSTTDTSARDGKQSKKSKWDTVKVGPDGRNLIPTGNHESLSAAAAHAALLSAANVGSGYTAFVQQKRREAEEKKSSDRKLERRS